MATANDPEVVPGVKLSDVVRYVRDGASRKKVALRDAMLMRCGIDHKPTNTDHADFLHQPLINIARQCLLVDGFSERDVDRLSYPDLARAAMGCRSALRNDAVHTTGTLGEITRDAVNKSLLAGYREAPQTWRGPMRQGTSVRDFKQISRVRLGAAPNLPTWPDGTVPNEVQLVDARERYAVEARAERLSFSWQLFVNDDLDALSRAPKLLGAAAARTVNATAWAQITSNPTMSDGQALFLTSATGNRLQANAFSGAATPTTATIGPMAALLRVMRGLNSPEGGLGPDVLNLIPRYIIGPAALETTIKVLCKSTGEPAATFSAGVHNPNAAYTPVIEPLLDATSTSAFYLTADPNQIDTVELTFLQGQEEPVTDDYIDPATWSHVFTVVQTFAAKVLDWRGMIRHAGA